MLYTRSPKLFFLVDCNNFFVSCERVFNPKLKNKPVVILSSNDGCVISRSQEAKALQIPMGAPFFEYEQLFKKHGVIVHSSNFALYADMSARVMATLETFSQELEIYSVDEAFLLMPFSLSQVDLIAYGYTIRQKIYQATGIPVSIGIGSTKTLAKLANAIAKKGAFVYYLEHNEQLNKTLSELPVNEVWGIGRRYNRFLQAKGIKTVLDLKNLDHQWARKQLTINGLKTVLELNGVSCFAINAADEVKKTITVSRMFGQPITEKSQLYEAVTEYTTSALRKLRNQNSLASNITVFVMVRQYHDATRLFYQETKSLALPTAYTPDFIKAAKKCIDQLYQASLIYKKVGVTLSGFVPADFKQLSLADKISFYNEEKENLMKAVDLINNKWGKNTVFYAAAGTHQQWWAKSLKRTPCYTTSWQELLKVRIA
ncbi:MAG: Y-family DNA polymerase [Candidatus Dependentiae bacterium]